MYGKLKNQKTSILFLRKIIHTNHQFVDATITASTVCFFFVLNINLLFFCLFVSHSVSFCVILFLLSVSFPHHSNGKKNSLWFTECGFFSLFFLPPSLSLHRSDLSISFTLTRAHAHSLIHNCIHNKLTERFYRFVSVCAFT